MTIHSTINSTDRQLIA